MGAVARPATLQPQPNLSVSTLSALYMGPLKISCFSKQTVEDAEDDG